MANIQKMWELFEVVDALISELAEGDHKKEEMLRVFFFRILSVLDGVEGPSVEWKGIALVAGEDLPEEVEEINDDFLHDAWSSRA